MINTKHITHSILFPLILFINVSCQNGTKKSVENTDSILIAQDTLAQVSSENTATDTLPTDVQILLPTQYRKENGYPKGVQEKEWYELYKDEKTGKWLVAKTNLKISYGRDECVGDDVMIITPHHDNTVLFFIPFAGFNTNITTVLQDKALFPEQTLAFNFNGKAYKLSPMGNVYDHEGSILPATTLKELTEADLDDRHISSYSLSFITPDGINQQIATIDDMQSVTPKVIWAGDINGDGLPDMLLDLRDFYESQHVFLFLSDKKDQTKPLKKVADLKIVNDC